MQRHCTVAKYGLMHLMAVNMCLWSRTVVDQTLRKLRGAAENDTTSMEVVITSSGNYTGKRSHSEIVYVCVCDS